MRTFYKLAVTMQHNVVLLHDYHHNIINMSIAELIFSISVTCTGPVNEL